MRSALLLGAVLLTAGACGSSRSTQCLIGASIACTCTDGRNGAQVCQSDQTLGACMCAGPSGAGGGSGGATAGTSGSNGTGGATGGMAGAAAGAPGTGGAGVPCLGSVPTETRYIGQGDANPNFQSGVGALGTNVMYLFSGYTSSAGDGGAGSQEIYAQAFDPKTGLNKGPSQPLFAPPTLGFESATYVGGTVYLFAAAVANTGDIAIVYQLINKTTSDAALYVALLSRSATNDGGVGGLQLAHVALVSTNFTAGANGDENNPKVFWSNASQTFVINYATPSASQTTLTNPLQMSISKYTASGQSAGGIGVVPLAPDMGASLYHRDLSSNGSVGESGTLLGVLYQGGADNPGVVNLTTLDESASLVGTPRLVAATGRGGWPAIAGTTKGFVCSFFGTTYVNVLFVPVSAGAVPADAGVSGFSLTSLPASSPSDGRAIADDVGTGGQGGVGLALVLMDGSIVFAYVNADGGGLLGPVPAFAIGGTAGAMSMTNFNGSFVLSTYSAATHSAQVVETGICP
jgi:hypothetical protein